MSATNSPVFDSNMDSTIVTEQPSQDNNPVVSQNPPKITKKQEKENERAAKKQAKEDAKKAKEDAKKAKEDAKKAKEDEKDAKKQAKEDAKKAKEDAKKAKEDAKKAKEDAKKAKEDEKAAKKLARENKKKKTNVSTEVPQEVSTEVPQEVSSEVPQEVSSEVSQQVSSEVPQEASQQVSSEAPLDLSNEVSNQPFDIDAKSSSLKTLPPKSLKFIEFAYFLIKHFEKSIPSLPIDSLLSLAHTFDSPSAQSLFIQNFFDNQKLIHADISRIRKTRSPSPSSSSSYPDFVSQIVHHALSHDSHDSLDIPIPTHPFSFNDQHFLIDNDNNLYHPSNHSHIGKWDLNRQTIRLF